MSSGLLFENRGYDFVELCGPSGSLKAWSLRADVYVTRLTGYIDNKLVTALLAHGDRLVAKNVRLHVFHDWLNVEHYDVSARVAVTTWTTRNIAQYASANVLAKSKLISMAVTVGNLAWNGTVKLYSKPEEFHECLHKCIKG